MPRRRAGGSGGAIRAWSRNAPVPNPAGNKFQLPGLGLKAPVAFAKSGGNANLSVNGTGMVSAVALMANNATQAINGTATGADSCVRPWSLSLTTPIVQPAAPTINSATPGNGKITLAWTDGDNGGVAITAHKLYLGAASGAEAYVGDILTGSPFDITGLTNGQAAFGKITAVNSAGLESTFSAEFTATPNTLTLLAGATSDINPSDFALWGNPATGTDQATLYDSAQGVSAAKTSATGALWQRDADGVGNPGLKFGSTAASNYYTLDRTIWTGITGAIDGFNWTIVTPFTALGGSASGWLIQINPSTTCRIFLGGATQNVGLSRGGSNIPLVTLGNTGFSAGNHVLMVKSTQEVIPGNLSNGRVEIWIDDCCVAESVTASPASSGNMVFGCKSDGNTSNRLQATILRSMTYPFAFTDLQMSEQTAYHAQRHNVPLTTKKFVMVGSSLGAGITDFAGQVSDFNIPRSLYRQIPTAPWGSIHMMCIGSIRTSIGMMTLIGKLANLVGRWGAANVAVGLMEGYNETAATLSAAASAAAMVTLLDAILAMGIPASQIYMATITGVQTTRPGYAVYADYVAALKAIPATAGGRFADLVIVDVDTDPHIGLDLTGYPPTYSGGFFDTVNGYGGTASRPGGPVHLDGVGGYIPRYLNGGVPGGTISGYPYYADLFWRDRVKAWLGV